MFDNELEISKKEEWKKIIDSQIPSNFQELFFKLNKIKRFRYHFCPDTVLIHTLRMFELHKNYFENTKNSFQRTSILLHDFEELFTGDIPTFMKNSNDKENEKFILIEIYKKVLSLDNLTLTQNIRRLLEIKNDSPNKNHIKVIDTFDGLMFSFHMIKLGFISYLNPFFYYLDIEKEKGFIKNLEKVSHLREYSFFNKTNKNTIFGKKIIQNGFKNYQNIIFDIQNNSFTTQDIIKFQKLEEEIIQGKFKQIQEYNAKDLVRILFKDKLQIQDFEKKLKELTTIFNSKSHYKEWLRINRKVLRHQNKILKEINTEFEFLNKQLIFEE